jgi:hypothetical protein
MAGYGGTAPILFGTVVAINQAVNIKNAPYQMKWKNKAESFKLAIEGTSPLPVWRRKSHTYTAQGF